MEPRCPSPTESGVGCRSWCSACPRVRSEGGFRAWSGGAVPRRSSAERRWSLLGGTSDGWGTRSLLLDLGFVAHPLDGGDDLLGRCLGGIVGDHGSPPLVADLGLVHTLGALEHGRDAGRTSSAVH